MSMDAAIRRINGIPEKGSPEDIAIGAGALERVRRYPSDFLTLAAHHRTEAVCLALVEAAPSLLRYLRTTDWTEAVALAAMRRAGKLLHLVPPTCRSDAVLRAAVENDGTAIFHLKDGERTVDLCEIAVRNNGNAVLCLEQSLRTPGLWALAINNELQVAGFLRKQDMAGLECEAGEALLNVLAERWDEVAPYLDRDVLASAQALLVGRLDRFTPADPADATPQREVGG